MAKTKKKTEQTVQTAGDIVKLYDNKRSSLSFSELFVQMENDFDSLSLVEYAAEPGHQSYTSPKPLNDFEKVLNGINKASLTWSIATPDDASEDARDAASKGEQILTGIFTQVDDQLSNVGEPPLRQSAGWIADARGCLGLICLIYNDDKKETVIDIRTIDTLHMAWEKGVKGFNWIAYEYTISKYEAKEKYGKEFTSDNVTVIDFYDTKNNAVILVDGSTKGTDNSQFIKEPTPHGFDHVPLWIEFAGSMPTIYNFNNQLQLKQRAKSWASSSRGIYKPFNKQVSFIMDTAEKSVAGTLVYETAEGKKQIQGDPFANWQVILTKTGEKLMPLEPPKVPPESSAILGILDRDKQESTVPYPIGYGIDTQSHSGAALSMLNDNMRSIYDPFASLMERAWKWLCREIFIQFKLKGQKLNLKGFNSDGKFFTLEVSPDDIDDNWYIVVKCEPKLPRDEAGELQMSIAARTPDATGRPLLSDLTIREKILKLQNPDAEDKRIEEQQVSRMIEKMLPFQVRKIAVEMVKQGDVQSAEELLSSIPAPSVGGQPGTQPQMGSPQGTSGMPMQSNNGTMPQLNPQQLEQVAQMAAEYKKQGKPIPPELQQVLQMSMQGVQPGGPNPGLPQ
jgi:hypothetical protein